MIHRKCPKCGTPQKTWIGYADLAIGIIILAFIIKTAATGGYRHTEIQVNYCDGEEPTITGINWEPIERTPLKEVVDNNTGEINETRLKELTKQAKGEEKRWEK